MTLLRSLAHRALTFTRSVSKQISVPSIPSFSQSLPFANAFKSSTPLTVQKRLYRQVAVSASAFFVIMSFAPTSGSFGTYANDIGVGYSGEMIFTDTDGYLTKLNPQTGESDRSTMSDKLAHVVENGETLSAISSRYGVKVETIMWENGLYNANSLKLGQELIIPPTDGVYHKIKEGDTLSKISENYKVEGDLIAKQNDISGEGVLSIGEELFIPGAKGEIATPPAPAIASRNTSARNAGTSRGFVADSNLPNASATASVAMIWPTSGKVTQGYGGYHPALDIAKYPGGPIWATKVGTVIKASVGSWGGGYGNHVVVDHGNGVKTLYAHMEYLTVNVGDQVTQGQVIGKMGNTGRVYGRTGVHLHFEVWVNGVKKNPWGFL